MTGHSFLSDTNEWQKYRRRCHWPGISSSVICSGRTRKHPRSVLPRFVTTKPAFESLRVTFERTWVGVTLSARVAEEIFIAVGSTPGQP